MDTSKNPHELETQKVSKLLWKYAVPAVLGTLSMSLYNIVDRIFIGQGVGAYAISGLALTFPIVTIIQAFGTLVGVGASARISIVLGMKDKAWAEKILGNSLVLTLFFWSLLTIFGLLYLDPILLAFGGSEETLPYAREYLRILIPASIFNNFCFSFSNIIRASGSPYDSMKVILIGVVLNVILDPIFIFGFDMGIQGAAYATLISMSVGGFFALRHFMLPSSLLHFRLSAMKLEPKIIRNIIVIGMSPFLMNLAASIVNVFMNQELFQYGGDLAIGAYGIINSYGAFFVMFVIGISQGMQPIVGYNYGAKKLKRMKDTLKLAIKISMGITTFGGIVCVLFPKFLAMVFSSDLELNRITAEGMRYIFLIFPLIGFQIAIANFFQSISKAWLSIMMSLLRQVVFLLPCLYLFSSQWGLLGVWIAAPVSDFMSVCVAAYVLWTQKKVFYR
ncbi:MAG: MATE family efflux transporter [Bacteroidales bacterium]